MGRIVAAAAGAAAAIAVTHALSYESRDIVVCLSTVNTRIGTWFVNFAKMPCLQRPCDLDFDLDLDLDSFAHLHLHRYRDDVETFS